jgi:very-short-patch-repair endonuclease
VEPTISGPCWISRPIAEKPDTAIARLAGEQWGVVSLHELLQCGVSHDGITTRVQSGRLHRLHRGVYAVGHPNIPLEGHFLAATKACGPTAVLSHYSAATLWGLVDWDDRRPEVIAATVKDHTGIRSHRSRTLRREDVTRRQGIPVTAPARTIRDLFSVLPYKGVRRAAARALSRRLLAPHHLPPRLATTIAPTRSELEDAVRDLILANGFEPPDVNRPLNIDGRRVIPDFRWPAQRMVVEADSLEWHDNPIARADDAERQAILEASGERVVRVTWEQAISRPRQTIARLNTAGAPKLHGQ